MKKLFTLVALLTVFLGAKAQDWEEVYTVDYTTYQGFPFYVMGYVPEFDNGWMTDFGANYKYAEKKDGAEETSDVIVKTQGGAEYYRWTEGGGWHQYFIADGIPTIIDGKYKVKALVKASEAATINVNMGWGWGNGESVGGQAQIPQSDDFVEIEWEYEGIGGTSCNLVAQPGGFTGVIEWKSLKVYQKKEEGGRPVVWEESLTNGDAEAEWPGWAMEETDGININWRTDKAPQISSWSLTMGKNKDAGPDELVTDDRSRPFPSDIEEEAGNPSNHVFAVHVTEINKIDDDASIQWSNQYWIQSSREYKAGEKVKISFRYKAEKACNVGTQWHKKNPSVYNNYTGVGSLDFTTDWQTFDKQVTLDKDGTWSLAFNLTSSSTVDKPQEPNVFYFDDLSWKYMVLDHGFFVTGINTTNTKEYTNLQLDEATQLEYSAEDEAYVAVVGKKGEPATYVDQVMISTVRGDAQSFKANTLKPEKMQKDCHEIEWISYDAASNSKINLPGLGVWTVFVDTQYNTIGFIMEEGNPYEAKDIYTYTDEYTVNAGERQDLKDDKNNEGVITVREEADDPDGVNVGGEGHEGQTWDNQFFITANRVLKAGEVTHLVFKYKATLPAAASNQCHGAPKEYRHWDAIGTVNFEEDWLEFDKDFTIPSQVGENGMKTIAFNLAEIKDANNYTFKDISWYMPYEEEGLTMENLISGPENFSKVEYQATGTGISTVVNKAKVGSAVLYNLAGQRVANDYKGIVVKDGKKFVK